MVARRLGVSLPARGVICISPLRLVSGGITRVFCNKFNFSLVNFLLFGKFETV